MRNEYTLGQKPTHETFAVKDTSGKAFWTKIGVA
jgi:hypothetical protein